MAHEWSEQQRAIFRWFAAPTSQNLIVRARAGCLTGSTQIAINRNGKGWSLSLAELAAKFNGVDYIVPRKDGQTPRAARGWDLLLPTFVQRDVSGVVRLGRIADVWASGVKKTYEVLTTEGRTIRATLEHPFLTTEGWLSLGNLRAGMRVYVRGEQRLNGRAPKKTYPTLAGLWAHPFAAQHAPDKSHRHGIARVPLHRLVAEANLNRLQLNDYLNLLFAGQIETLQFIDPTTYTVYHKDRNPTNNALGNLEVLTIEEHRQLHAREGTDINVAIKIDNEVIERITEYGEEETYDIAVADAPHNFLANGFVVHNTGKTTTILEALNHIQWTIGAGERGLVCAFNKRIAEELTLKLKFVEKIEAKTLHALGFLFLRNAWGDLKVDNDVEKERIDNAIIGRRPQWDIIASTRKLMSFAKGAEPMIGVDGLEAMAIEQGLDIDPNYEYDARWMAQVVRRAMDASLERDDAKRISFDDMIFVPAALNFSMKLYDWVIVDEAQDMNAAQLTIARGALKDGGHIVIVGDDRQAIYGFRGADTNCLDRLKAELNAEELGLTTTYRCPRNVVAEANKLVEDFYAPETAPDGQVIDGTWEDVLEKARPGDAILSRTNAPLVPLCLSFIRKQVPAKIEGRDIGKMLAARAKKMKATTVEEFLEKLAKWSSKAISRALASQRNVDAKLQQLEDVRETLEAIADDCESMPDYYARCEKLFEDIGQSGSCIVLSTVHKAKGLEWDRVFILSGTLYCNGKRTEDREEANIHYVAVTRSKSALMLVGGHAAV